VLTTYETLRDYDRDFGAVRFAAMLLDEAQKVKTPGIRLTDAAKAMNADFRMALTGTPVENRLSDLWCIVDGVAPGHLGDLRRFSATYEAAPTVERLVELKSSLDRPIAGRPPLLLRRLKEDRLPDLPPRTEEVARAEMSGVQLVAYEEAVALGRSDQGTGRVLEALQRLRAVSLHPDVEAATDDADLASGSARLRLALDALDGIAERGERALIFLDDLTMMARMAGLLQRRYRLPAAPLTINGKVTGAARQSRVDRFQGSPGGFDVMLLSPRAGGVGLTLTRANHVIHLARWWNPAVEDQCTGRVLRIGQENPVTVHIPLAVLPGGRHSFDENLHALLDRKRKLMRDALMPPDPQKDDLAAMLRDSLF
jgi:SNF2 family DNA or RNA helicase